MMKQALTYKDVSLIPRFSTIFSRRDDEINTSTVLGYYEHAINLKIPIITSPMDTISGHKMATAMNDIGGLSIIHRTQSIEEFQEELKEIPNGVQYGISIGVNEKDFARVVVANKYNVSLICVDIAHGHHILMKETLSFLRKHYPEYHIMAGNVCTLEGFNDLSDWGADSIKVGIGSGAVCSTRIETGNGIPNFSAICDCAKTTRKSSIIADGGITCAGDIVKALAAGADAVMLGRLVAGTIECPVQQSYDGTMPYRGMASKEVQSQWKGYLSPEGISINVPFQGSVKDIINRIMAGVRSGFSYQNARTLYDLRAHAEFVIQTFNGYIEGTPHGKL
ncbi:guanosine monophosphate reductase [Candidatus Pacearchaeota archaeon]|nr:guanosine monophosphate reductase [Candidatus Pacearchaeota archaeon]